MKETYKQLEVAGSKKVAKIIGVVRAMSNYYQTLYKGSRPKCDVNMKTKLFF